MDTEVVLQSLSESVESSIMLALEIYCNKCKCYSEMQPVFGGTCLKGFASKFCQQPQLLFSFARCYSGFLHRQ